MKKLKNIFAVTICTLALAVTGAPALSGTVYANHTEKGEDIYSQPLGDEGDPNATDTVYQDPIPHPGNPEWQDPSGDPDYSQPIGDPGDTNTVGPADPSSGSPEPDYSQPLGDECWDYCYGAY